MTASYLFKTFLFCMILSLTMRHANAQIADRRPDPKIQTLVEQAIEAHGGKVLTQAKAFQETSEMRASGPFGMRTPAQRCRVWLDRQMSKGRWQMNQGDTLLGIYQETPEGTFLWSKGSGSQKTGKSDASPFVPLIKTGVFGLLALRNTSDTLTFVEKGEIKGIKGRMIVRSQSVPRETLRLAGREGLLRESCRTTWCYLFAPDGTLIAERITQAQPKKVSDIQLSYDRFQVFDGVKVPTEIGVKSSLVPRGFSLKIKVTKFTVNAPVAASEFQMP